MAVSTVIGNKIAEISGREIFSYIEVIDILLDVLSELTKEKEDVADDVHSTTNS